MLQNLVHERKLIWILAKNDFKKRFAGASWGLLWALLQPTVTVLVYWFVFGAGIRQGAAVEEVPFVLWMLAGLVPWFYFQEVLNGGTNVLIEYSYLVKKVVFKIEILPMIKGISALFIHVFFVCITFILYLAYGKFSGIYSIQVIYYSACMFLMVLGVCYATSAIAVFFRDLSQIVNIGLQIGVWITPIMWNLNDMQVPEIVKRILMLNPMYYIVYGYRDALVEQVWFWQRPWQSLYFWCFTMFAFCIGSKLFQRLRGHFADVL